MDDIVEPLQQIDRMVRSDPRLAVKAFGILLLGKKFEEQYEERIVDPTDLILNRGGPTIPEL